MLYVKDHHNSIRFPIPMPVFKGTKRKYVNDVILFGEMRNLNKVEYTYTDYTQALHDSYNLHVLNMDNICLVLNNVNMLSHKKVGQCEVKGLHLICQNKKIAKLSNDKEYLKDGSVVQVLYKDDKSKIMHLKVEKRDYIGKQMHMLCLFTIML